ncbi:MAG TPA: formate dehydrogenase accessory sulfurtransferase FdhD [Polyangiaceae bacterium]|jgi:FdhD protein
MNVSRTARVPVRKLGRGASTTSLVDALAIEEPLEIRAAWRDDAGVTSERAIAVTMRTPGHDGELAAGFLVSEGILTAREQVAGIDEGGNVVRVDLAPGVRLDLGAIERHVYVSSSCGVCGKSSIDSVRTRGAFAPAGTPTVVDPRIVHEMPDVLRRAQSVFDETGGLHAAGLFDARGQLVAAREDVGRHNAVDKLVGASLLRGALPLHNHVLCLSGRTSFELVQKAAMAGIDVVVSVGAPSSLAVELAREGGMTLLGFVRDGRFNVYTGGERLVGVGDG